MPPTSRRWTARRSGWPISACRRRPGRTSCSSSAIPTRPPASRRSPRSARSRRAPRSASSSGVFAEEDDPLVRSRAVAALTRLDGPGARGLLRERALADEDAELRMQALNALARLERRPVGQRARAGPAPGPRARGPHERDRGARAGRRRLGAALLWRARPATPTRRSAAPPRRRSPPRRASATEMNPAARDDGGAPRPLAGGGAATREGGGLTADDRPLRPQKTEERP